MFAVKGWSVNASALKAQTESPGAAGASKKSKKRKRDGDRNGQVPSVEETDVGSLWDRHIEGIKPPRQEEKRKKSKQDLSADGLAGSDDRANDKRKKTKDEPSSDASKGQKSKVDNVKGGRAQQETSTKQAGKNKAAARESAPSNSQAIQKGAPPATTKLTPMQSAMRQKLISARFRHLNETLYTAPSGSAQSLFDQNPDMFEDYHAGFRQQVSVWPENPLDSFIDTIRGRGKVKQSHFSRDKKPKQHRDDASQSLAALPRTHGTAIITDLGCGDARLAHTLTTSNEISSLNLKLQSFDLYSPSKLVTKADISNLPVEDGSVDIAIFCLALMGTNWISFIEEAYRILHWKGELWIAEIKSRFGRIGREGKPVEHSVGNKRKLAALKKAKERKDQERQEFTEQEVLQTEVDGVVTAKEETDVSAFVEVLRRRGFVLKDGEKSIDLSNKMFVRMEFLKAAAPTKGKCVQEKVEEKTPLKAKPKLKFLNEVTNEPTTDDEAKVLKPCLYKIR